MTTVPQRKQQRRGADCRAVAGSNGTTARTWDRADRHLGLAELGIVTRDDDVAHHRQLTATTKGVAVHCSNALQHHASTPHDVNENH